MDKAANNINWWNRAAKIKKMILSGWTLQKLLFELLEFYF